MRRWLRTLLLAATTIGFASSLGFSRADEPPTRPAPARQTSDATVAATAKASAAKSGEDKSADAAEPSIWMKKKLDYSQEILAGLATADFARIQKHAELMKGLGKVEAFVRGRTPGYRAQYQIFQEATDELARQAAKENVDGAALAFTQLTISCVNCHKQLRESAREATKPRN